MIKIIISIILLCFTQLVICEPWINTNDLQLRSDIETLSDLGIITVPITTYPLMWAGIIKDIDNSDIRNIPAKYKAVYWRVKKSGKVALSNRPKRLLKTSLATSEKLFRSFGDSDRGKAEITANNANLNKHFAWNLQVTRVADVLDGDNFYYDGSYIAAVWGNWNLSLGLVEKWWGASWDSTNLMSNNARPPLGITLNRNYSDAIEYPVLSWLGPWSFSGFVSKLEDTAAFSNPYLGGVSFSLKPLDSIEVSLRATSIFAGTAKQFTPNIDPKVLTGLDLRWRLPIVLTSQDFLTSFNFAVTDEGQSATFATIQYGLSTSFNIYEENWRIYLETTDTSANASKPGELNTTFEDGVYTNGYRLNGRAIGSTYDADSKVTTIGLMGSLGRYQTFSLKLQDLKINQNTIDGINIVSPLDARHSVNADNVNTKRVIAKWQIQIDRFNQLDIELDFSNKVIDGFDRQDERYRIAIGWSYYL